MFLTGVLCYITGVFFVLTDGGIGYERKYSFKKKNFGALFLAIGLILPFITMQIPAVGKMLCPMHIPVLLCGYICGWHMACLLGLLHLF